MHEVSLAVTFLCKLKNLVSFRQFWNFEIHRPLRGPQMGLWHSVPQATMHSDGPSIEIQSKFGEVLLENWANLHLTPPTVWLGGGHEFH